MDSLIDQKYVITNPPDANLWIGADIPHMRPGATAPVITKGEMKFWSLERGYLVLNDIWYSAHDGDQVVVRTGVHEGTGWKIVRVSGLYQIILPENNTAWTSTSGDPKKPVLLTPLEPGNSNQLWQFNPLQGEY